MTPDDIHTLGDLLDWGRAQSPALAIDEIITQDEYTHDVLVQQDPFRWLVFDIT